MADFADTPQASARRVDKSDYLSVTADFNGDGKDDEARILLNEGQKVAYVVVVIQSATKVDTYVLSQTSLHDVKNVGISLAPPVTGSQSQRFAGVTIFAIDSGQGEANYFDGEDFNTRVAVPAKVSKSS